MKPWAKYKFDGINWIPDREADIITAMREAQEKRNKEFYEFIQKELWAPILEEEKKKEITMDNIAPTNVISFTYLNSKNDEKPVLLVTGFDDTYVWGYNLNYYAEQGLAYRKYFRAYMRDTINLTEQTIELSKPKPKPKPLALEDLKVGEKATYSNYPGITITKVSENKDGRCQVVASTVVWPFGDNDLGRMYSESIDAGVNKV